MWRRNAGWNDDERHWPAHWWDRLVGRGRVGDGRRAHTAGAGLGARRDHGHPDRRWDHQPQLPGRRRRAVVRGPHPGRANRAARHRSGGEAAAAPRAADLGHRPAGVRRAARRRHGDHRLRAGRDRRRRRPSSRQACSSASSKPIRRLHAQRADHGPFPIFRIIERHAADAVANRRPGARRLRRCSPWRPGSSRPVPDAERGGALPQRPAPGERAVRRRSGLADRLRVRRHERGDVRPRQPVRQQRVRRRGRRPAARPLHRRASGAPARPAAVDEGRERDARRDVGARAAGDQHPRRLRLRGLRRRAARPLRRARRSRGVRRDRRRRGDADVQSSRRCATAPEP